MKRKRTIIILITLISYFFFVLVVTVVGVNDESSTQDSKIIVDRGNNIYFNMELIFSVSLNSKHSSGLDPTPNPPLPPNIENDIAAEIMD